MTVQAGPLSQVVRHEYQSRVGLKKTIFILDVGVCLSCLCSQKAYIAVSETSMRAAVGRHAVYRVTSKQQWPTISITSPGAHGYNKRLLWLRKEAGA